MQVKYLEEMFVEESRAVGGRIELGAHKVVLIFVPLEKSLTNLTHYCEVSSCQGLNQGLC